MRPHRSETFKLSTDPFFLEKLCDVVGLYLNPPDKTLMLCVDEKSQVQALERLALLQSHRHGVPKRDHANEIVR